MIKQMLAVDGVMAVCQYRDDGAFIEGYGVLPEAELSHPNDTIKSETKELPILVPARLFWTEEVISAMKNLLNRRDFMK
ncbi:MAG: DUF2173 family protein, partial [Gammaproteobacteria bacterium]|nr:DUF2173 family protein [Gammaproteobacteria bacterium]